MAEDDMQPYFEHPTEEALERFLLNRSQEPELEVVETHILACNTCVERLEAMEVQIAVTKAALTEPSIVRAPEPNRTNNMWRKWFSVPVLSWAASAAVAAALCIAAFLPARVELSAYRGTEMTMVPEWRPLHMHLNAEDIADGAVAVQLVNAEGAELWTGTATVQRDQADVHLPRIYHAGSYFVRLYEPAEGGARGDLLREFPFQVK